MRDQLRAAGLLISTAFRVDTRRSVLVLSLAPIIGGCGVLSGIAIRAATNAALDRDPRSALTAVTLLVISVIATHTVGAFVSTLRIRLQQHVGLMLDQQLIAMAAGTPTLSCYENPEYLDRMDLVRANRSQLGGAFGALVENLRAVSGVAATVTLLTTVHPVLLVLPLFALPAVVTSQLGSRMVGRVEQDTAESERLRRGLLELACSVEAAREARVYRLADELTSRHDALQDGVDRAGDRADARAARWSGCGWLVFAAGYLGAVLLSIVSVTQGTGTPGDVVLTLVLGAQLLGAVSGIVALGAWLQQALRSTGYFLWLHDHAARSEPERAHVSTIPPRASGELVLDHVSFTYPGTDHPVLTDVCLRVPAGGTLAIVGENGAGKTTLVKLLCRMYEPTSGTITYDGMDITTLDVSTWRAALSACFQDFQRFELTLNDGVGIGDLRHLNSPRSVRSALARGGGSDLPSALPDGLDTQLGPTFPGGVDLSTGQWQKVAMSRAMMRPVPCLLVLDEPTASLDAASENALFARHAVARMPAGPITVLVSHRFTTVAMADVIVVLDGGQVRAVGSHRQLLARDAGYAELYTLGTRGYTEPPPSTTHGS